MIYIFHKNVYFNTTITVIHHPFFQYIYIVFQMRYHNQQQKLLMKHQNKINNPKITNR